MKIPKNFNAVRESRKWKRSVARKLEGMTNEEIVAFFRGVREKYATEQVARREAVLAH